MQRIFKGLLLFIFSSMVLGTSAQTSSDHQIPRLKDHKAPPRVYKPMGCKWVDMPGHLHSEKKILPVENYDMSESISRSDTFDISHYEVDLDVTNYNYAQMKAHCAVSLSILETGSTSIWFDLLDMTVDSVFIDGSPQPYTHLDGRLTIDAPNSGEFTAGNEHLINIHYNGHPAADSYWGGVYFASNYIYHMGIGLTTIPPNFGKAWHPCFDNFIERATYTWHVRSSGGRKAHLQGTYLGEVLEEGDTLVRSFTLQHPITTHQAAFAVSNYVDSNYVHTGAFSDIPIRLTAKPDDIVSMTNRFQNLGQAIDAMEWWFGPYSWERVGYVITTDGALEIPTNIAYPRYMMEENLITNEQLLGHELGHQWWGNLVAPETHNHMWLKEGGAEYSEHLFFEWMDGHDAFVEITKDNQEFVLEECHIQDNGFHSLSPIPDAEIYGRHTYYKGASIQHNLRAYMGDEMYRLACTNVFNEFYDSYMGPDDFKQSLEDYSGIDMDPFFDAHVYQPGFSTWVIDSTSTEGNAANGFNTTLYLNQKLRECNNFHFNEPLDVCLWNAEWDTTLVEVRVGGEYDVVTIQHDEPFELIALNADGKLNQGRLDYTVAVTETSGTSSLPWVDMRLGCDAIDDSVLVRLEHHWAAPDQGPLGFYIDEISDVHFWTVDGSWDGLLADGMILEGRFTYAGNEDTDLDHDLYNGGEENAFLAWRPDADSEWVQYPDYTWQAGSLLNGNGTFNVTNLRKGQYTFANGDVALDVADIQVEAELDILVAPSPAVSDMNVVWPEEVEANSVRIYDSAGRFVFSQSVANDMGRVHLDVSDLSAGMYSIVVLGGGKKLGSASFLVE